MGIKEGSEFLPEKQKSKEQMKKQRGTKRMRPCRHMVKKMID